MVVVKAQGPEGEGYFFTDKYRVPAILVILVLFLLVVIIFSGLKGAMSILGLTFTILILVLFVVPQIAKGQNPILISLIGTFIIAFISLYLAHGFTKRTTIALISTLLTLNIAPILSIIFVNFAKLFGLGSEEAGFLQIG